MQLHNKEIMMAKKYYKVPRFIKIQEVDESDKRIEADWVEVNKDGSPMVKSQSKSKSKGE